MIISKTLNNIKLEGLPFLKMSIFEIDNNLWVYRLFLYHSLLLLHIILFFFVWSPKELDDLDHSFFPYCLSTFFNDIVLQSVKKRIEENLPSRLFLCNLLHYNSSGCGMVLGIIYQIWNVFNEVLFLGVIWFLSHTFLRYSFAVQKPQIFFQNAFQNFGFEFLNVTFAITKLDSRLILRSLKFFEEFYAEFVNIS